MKNEILKAKCIDMTYEGYGVCKIDGLVIFVKDMIIDEEAMIKIISHKKNLAYAIISEMIKPSIHRTISDCPIAYKCGGCNLRHIEYSFQLELKRKWLKETLKTVGNIDIEVPSTIASPLTLHHRNKVQVPIADGKIGFYRTFSHDIVENDNCLIQSKKANDIINFLKPIIIDNGYDKYFRHILIKEGFKSGEIMLGLILNTDDFNGLNTLVSDVVNKFRDITSVIVNVNKRDDNVILGDKERVLYGSSYIIDKLDDLEFKISLKSFYQTNPLQTENLYREIVNIAKIDKTKRVLDLYSGIGTISLFLAKYAKEVIGVEVVADAIINAKDNALLNNIDNAYFYHDDATKNMSKYLDGIDLVVVDPPRKGLSKNLIEEIVNNEVKEVVYVSCNPATLARDLRIFIDEGYEIKYLQGFDMFPHTVHIETIVLLSQ